MIFVVFDLSPLTCLNFSFYIVITLIGYFDILHASRNVFRSHELTKL